MPVTDGCKPAGNRTGTCWPGPGETEIVSTRPLLTEGEDMKRNTKKLLFALGLILPAFAMLCLSLIHILSYLISRYATGTLYYMGLAAPAASVLSILICGVLLAKQQRRGNGRGKPRP